MVRLNCGLVASCRRVNATSDDDAELVTFGNGADRQQPREALGRTLVHDLDDGRDRAVAVVGEDDALCRLVDGLLLGAKKAAARRRGSARENRGEREQAGHCEVGDKSKFQECLVSEGLPCNRIDPV